MSQVILRAVSGNSDVELCIQKKDEIIYKNISIKKATEILNKYAINENSYFKPKLSLLDDQIVGLGQGYVIINQPEHKKIVVLSSKSYKIMFPNAIYILYFKNDKINEILAFAYKKYEREKTKLFEYPMPNELSGNSICMGSANRTIEDNNYTAALERIIATEYTHSTFSGIKGFSQSSKWFEHLSKNEFPYKLMKSLNKSLKDVLK